MTAPVPTAIDVWSDFVCPWCYLGKRRLERALATLPGTPVEVRWHAFQLDPTTIELTMSTPSAGTILSALSDRAGMMASPTAIQAAGSSDAFSLAPVGSGMY